MKILSILSLLAICCLNAEEMNWERFSKKYSLPTYQDIVTQHGILAKGTDMCAQRFELIKPVLEKYDRKFTVLDVGAAQGYFSFRIAREYPHSFCVMVDANTTIYKDYSNHGDMLYDLCSLNSDLNNFCYVNKELSFDDLFNMNQREHFDVLLAFLVIHLMSDSLDEKAKIIEQLLNLSDNVIIEVANNVDIPLTQYVEQLSKKIECEYLGEVKRHYDPQYNGTGKLFWFKNHHERSHDSELPQEEVLLAR